MLNSLIEEFKDKVDLSDYFSYVNFEIVKEEILLSNNNLIFLLGTPGSGKTFMINYLLNKFPEKFQLYEDFEKIKNSKTLLIDEAQLLDEKELERIRVLSDKGLQVLFAMHLKEGEKIINKPQFTSRYFQKIYMKPLDFEDFSKYVKKKFIKHEKEELLKDKLLKKIYKHSNGNFRLGKKIIFTSLNLLDFAFRNNLKYKQINNCILEMSLMQIGLK